MKSSMSPAIEDVEGNDDLLMAILIRLPPKAIFKFRFVSTRWNSIIADDYFLESYNTSARTRGLLAIIQTTHKLCHRPPDTPRRGFRPPLMNVLPVLPINAKKIVEPVRSELGYFISSSNGLILCGHHPETYYILNLLTRRCISLPPPPKSSEEFTSMALMCIERTNKFELEYKVISAPYDYIDDIIPIHIYCSKTREWAESNITGNQEFTLGWPKPPLALNGVLHWYSLHDLAICDFSFHHVNRPRENHVQLIGLPHIGIRRCTSSFTRSTNDDVLWFGVINDEGMKCWMLPTISDREWILMHTIGIDILRKDGFSLLMEDLLKTQKRVRKRVAENYWRIVEEGPFRLEGFIWLDDAIDVVLRLHDQPYIYHLKSNSLEMVDYVGRATADNVTFRCLYYGWYPYVESSVLSSYAL